MPRGVRNVHLAATRNVDNMQLEFSFVAEHPEWQFCKQLKKNAKITLEKLFENYDWKKAFSNSFGEYYRSADVFIYRWEPQLQFPHSEYWGCEDCEP